MSDFDCCGKYCCMHCVGCFPGMIEDVKIKESDREKVDRLKKFMQEEGWGIAEIIQTPVMYNPDLVELTLAFGKVFEVDE